MADDSIPALSPKDEEELVEFLLTQPESTTCLHDAERAIGEKLSIDPSAAHVLLESLLKRSRLEVRTASYAERPANSPSNGKTAPQCKLARPSERNWK